MAVTRYVDPITRRFVKKEDAERLQAIAYVSETNAGRAQEVTFEDWSTPDEPDISPTITWNTTEQERIFSWVDFTEDTLDDLSIFGAPSGARRYRVFLNIDDDPNYDRGVASTEWLPISDFNPSLDIVRNLRGSSFKEIRFQRS